MSFYHPSNNIPRYYYPHFRNDETGVQRGRVTRPKSHHTKCQSQDLNPDFVGSAPTHTTSCLMVFCCLSSFLQLWWAVVWKVYSSSNNFSYVDISLIGLKLLEGLSWLHSSVELSDLGRPPSWASVSTSVGWWWWYLHCQVHRGIVKIKWSNACEIVPPAALSMVACV